MTRPTSINSLPPEILLHMFYIITANPCGLRPYSSQDKQLHLGYPDHLAQVCTLWRDIAISSLALWRHIDLSPNEPYSDALITRAEAHAAHAGKLPIELHIAVNAMEGLALKHDELYRFILLISNRVEGLELAMIGPFRDFHRGVFKILLSQCPALTKLVIRPQSQHYNRLLVANSSSLEETASYSGPIKLDSTENEIKSSFARLAILHTCGIFPLWSSTAYHGLVDLRLLSTNQRSYIKEAQLVAILKSSPGLRILHLGLNIYGLKPQVIPVDLPDLQVINLRTLYTPNRVLRLLAPGTKLLRLTFGGLYVQDNIVYTELKKFFARSRVAKFYTRGMFPPLSLLTPHSANLDEVVLDSFESTFYGGLPSNLASESLSRLKTFHITRSTLFDSELRLLLECCPDGIVLNSCNIRHRVDIRVNHSNNTALGRSEILGSFPTVRITDRALYPEDESTADWDILD